MSEREEKPFWFSPPYVVLFDLLRLHRLKPWDVNIAYLLNNFLSEMKKSGFIDFTASGTALLSSSTIHRMKSELVLKMEEPPRLPQPRPNETIPPPLPLPIRYEYTSMSVEEILKALREVLDNERRILAEQKRSILLPSVLTESLDDFLTNIDDRLEQFYAELVRLSEKSPILSFRKINRRKSVLETIRRFLLLLFLACQGKLTLFQENELEDIRIRVEGVAAKVGAD